jgi:hypothetical protein
MMTPRRLLRNAFRCGNYEGEDVLCEVDDVDLVPLRGSKSSMMRRELHKRIVWHDFTRKTVSMNLAFRPTALDRDYDLFVAYLPFTQDLIHLPAVKGWRKRCQTSVCWIDEIWVASLARLKSWLPAALDAFDHIVIGFQGTVEPLSEMLGRPCHFVPIAVDTLRFSPFPRQLPRSIDILSVGRRRAEIHRACSQFADRAGLFYVHDTFNGSDAEVDDHREHRGMLANMIKHSRFFIVAPAKAGTEEGSRGQVEVGLRYYEGAAGGAVMVGESPACDAFRTLFDWQDAVIDVTPDGSDVVDVLGRLNLDPDRVADIGRHNATEALLRHDWVYRWEKILEIVGLKPTPALLARKARLLELAKMGADERNGRSPARHTTRA